MAPSDPSPHRLPDSRFGEITGFDLIERIGGGAWGEVWSATQRALGRLVAVKLLPSALTPGERDSERAAQLAWRFQREIEAAAVQDHPNIVRVFTSGVAEGRPWYAMELIEGLPLDEFAIAQNLPMRERLELFLQVCAGVQHAHDGGVIHRDLKPANILVGADAQPKILDFGLARFLDDSGLGCTLSLNGQPLGTPMFMAPEQAAGKVNEVGIAADVYALGVNLYRLATDSWPFDEKLPPLQLLAAARDAEPRPPRGIPRDIAAIIVKAMAREKGGRYASVGAFAEDVRRHLAGEPVAARVWTLGYMVRRRARKHWRGFAVGAFLSVLSVAFVLAHLETRRRTAARNVRALAQARELVNVMLFDLRGKLEAIERPDLFADVAAQAEKLPWPVDADTTGNLDLHRSQALSATSRGDVLLGSGNAPKALEAYREAVAHLAVLARQHRGEARYELDEATARFTFNSTLSKIGRHREAAHGIHAILRTLDALHDPELDEPINRLRAQSHRAAGTALRACGKLADAENEFGAALALFSKPPAADPHMRALLQEDLGDVRRKCARPAEALAALTEAEEHHRRAHAEAPQEGIVSIDLARCLTGEAAARLDLSDPAAAQRCLDEARDLCGAPGANVSLTAIIQQTRDVANGYAALAKMHDTAGDDPTAITADREAVQLWQAVFRRVPIQTSDRTALLEVRRHMACIQLRHEQRAEAAESLRAALDQSRALAREHIDDARWYLLVVEIELEMLDLPQPPPAVPRDKLLERIAVHLSRFDALPHTATDAHQKRAGELRARLAEETAK